MYLLDLIQFQLTNTNVPLSHCVYQLDAVMYN